jgi:exosome complex exonuclease RRP6
VLGVVDNQLVLLALIFTSSTSSGSLQYPPTTAMPSDIAGDFSSFQDDVYSAIMSTVKAASALASTDIPFQRSSDPDFASTADATSARILSFANQLLRSAAGGSDVEPPVLKDEDDIENKWRDIVEVADFLLERADTCLDEYTGAIKQKNPEPLPGAIMNRGLSRTQKKGQAYRANTNSALSRNLAKPQLLFEVKVDNMDNSPFRPLLTAKPHAKVPLEESLEMFTNESGNMQYVSGFRY